MIKTFKQSYLEEFWNTGKQKRIPPNLSDRILRKLDILNAAKEIRDLSSPHSNKMHPLHGNREGQWAVAVSGQWRLCFKFKYWFLGLGKVFELLDFGFGYRRKVCCCLHCEPKKLFIAGGNGSGYRL